MILDYFATSVSMRSLQKQLLGMSADFNLHVSADENMSEEYAAGQMAMDALSLVFGNDELAALNDNSCNIKIPIGFELLHNRAQPTQSSLNYNDCKKATVNVVEQWKIALFQWASKWSSGRCKCQFDSISTAGGMPSTKKQKTSFGCCNTMRRPHKYCYIVGCSCNDLTTKLIRVPNILQKIPQDASPARQRTY